MATTIETFAGAVKHNYCTLPTIDVEILPDIRHCETCGEPVTHQPDRKHGLLGGWVHTSSEVPDHGRVSPRTRCRYCNSDEHARYVQHAWFDAIECSRCGGVDGFAIGD
ncbi:hypothetical protein [Mycobacterium hubeiense]|uniref:hypothetical protein n=1 Tax=Mycobacterium hubeiense TaxID=1867256 RepID=UPI000C7F1513|nr:hypothetical protein [Mycobacterium sp. QGD 101]